MADEDEEDSGPIVELGEGDPVEGAPLARVASRLFYGIERSEVIRREGETTIRTPGGPQELGDVLDGIDETYFDTRQALVDAVEDAVGTGPVPTTDGEREVPTIGEEEEEEADTADDE
ncbi:DUF5789 family protein [Salinirubellus sp. GCM10025818]|uniref:DUF5789 family protein n=1 Tax=Salinirubellus TaxID=2162630 RepID=UPI00360A9203